MVQELLRERADPNKRTLVRLKHWEDQSFLGFGALGLIRVYWGCRVYWGLLGFIRVYWGFRVY